jgi:shikimate dehydrogenase
MQVYEMKKYGLTGYPLGHSFSKQYFAEKFRNENIADCVYDNYPLENISLLPDLVIREPLLLGLNVTIPHKKAVIPFLNKISDLAAEVGAVNVLKIKRISSGVVLSGFNTDVPGFTEALMKYFRSDVKKAIVLGTGGSSGAVCYSLNKLGFDLIRVSRNKDEDIIAYKDLSREILLGASLIVNTTPLGMYPDVDACPEIDYSLLDSRHMLFDLVYNPEVTLFLKRGKDRGCTVLNGLEMLKIQAEKSWKIWNDDSL